MISYHLIKKAYSHQYSIRSQHDFIKIHFFVEQLKKDAFCSTVELAKYLVAHGIEFEAINDNGKTPLIIHIGVGEVDIVTNPLCSCKNRKDKTSLDISYAIHS